VADGTQNNEADVAAENERLRAEVEHLRSTKKAVGRRRLRGVAMWLLVVLTSLSLVATIVGVWVQRTLASEDRYVELVAPLADNPAVQDALAVQLTDEAFLALDVENRVRASLESIGNVPDAAQLLVGPLVAGFENLIRDRVDQFLASDQFSQLWSDVNRAAHPKVQALLNGDYDELPNVEVSGGEVRLLLVPIVAEVLRVIVDDGLTSLGIDVTIPEIPASIDPSEAIQQLGSTLGVTLPEDFGQVTVLTADELSTYQSAVQTAKRVIGGLFVLTMLLLVATVLVAVDRRRAVIALGIGIAVTLFLGGVVIRRIERDVIDVIEAPGARAAAQDVYGAVIAGLRGVGIWVLVVALAAALAAYLSGRPAWFSRLLGTVGRSTTSKPGGSDLDVWVAAHAEVARIAAVAVGVVVLYFTGIDWVPLAVVGLVLALLLWGVTSAQQRVRGPDPA
jgi:hypothetical protein